MASKPSPTAAGIAAMVVGFAAAGFGVFGLGMVGLQRMILSSLRDPKAADFIETAGALHHAWLINLPLWILVGAALAWQGFRLRRRLPGAAESVAALSLVSVVALISYGFDTMSVAPSFEKNFARGPWPFPVSIHAWMVFSMVTTIGVVSAILITLAAFAWRARSASPA